MPSTCADHLACNDGGTACVASCQHLTDCASGFYCDKTGACIAQQIIGGICNSDDACTSGICGAKGLGHCCSSSCPATDPICGIIDCDATGACLYADGYTLCAGGCTGETHSDDTYCDGMGGCPPALTQLCAPFICTPSACLQSCGANTDCADGNFCCASAFCPDAGGCFAGCRTTGDCQSGQFCEVGGGNCCPNLPNGSTLEVDAVRGSDTGCCGYAGALPCLTLSKATELVDSAQAEKVTLVATVEGDGGDWTAPEASYPIVLGWAVKLSAPGVYFLDPNGGHSAVFAINFYSAADTLGYASIVGTTGSAVGVGMNATNTLQTSDGDALVVETGNTLYLANATVNGSASYGSNAIEIAPGGSLWLGQDQSAGVSGTVTIGNVLGQTATDGFIGILCDSDSQSLGCTVEDVPLQAGESSVVIQGQEGTDILAWDFSSISLAASPVFGVPPSFAGFGECAQKADGIGYGGAILLAGQVTLALENAVIQCVTGWGLYGQAGNNGNPTATVDHSIIENTDIGIYASAGTFSVTNSTIRFNFVGIRQDTDGTNNGQIDLSDGGNTVICSSNVESSSGSNSPGIDVYNTSTANLNADNVAWDTSSPDYFDCDSAFTTCTCNRASCTLDGGSDGMDAVEDSTNLGGITATGNTLSAFVLDAGCI
jgi:hypothetical protein